jgi:cytochrome c oxidase assembly protein subunit 15
MSLKIGLQRLGLPAFERLSLRCPPPIAFRPNVRSHSTIPRPPTITIPRSFARPLSTITSEAHFPAAATAPLRPERAEAATEIPRSLPRWLFGCSALVFGIVVIGGLTRLTESGLSITEWEPFTGILPPITAAEWDVEWEKYRVSPEGIM